MKKFISFIFVLFILILNNCTQQPPKQSHVKFAQSKNQIIYSYIPGANSPLFHADSITLQALLIPVNPTPREILENGKMLEKPMKRHGESWTVSIKPDNLTGCVVFQFKSGKKVDNNNNKGWVTIIYGKNGKPVKGAYSALSQVTGEGVVSYLMNLKTFNADTALFFYKKEMELYPDNWRARAVSINLRYRKALKENNQVQIDNIKKEFDGYIHEHPHDLKILELAYTFYLRPNPDKANQILKEIERINPSHRYVLSRKINRIRKIKDVQERIKKYESLEPLVQNTNSYFTWANYFLNDLLSLKKWNQIILVSKQVIQNLESSPFIYPSYSKEKRDKSTDSRLFTPLKALALSYYKIGNNKEAEKYYQKIGRLNLYPHQRVAFIEDYLEFLITTNQLDKAITLSLNSIKKAQSSKKIEELFQKAYVLKTGNKEEAENMLLKAKKESGVYRKDELSRAMITNAKLAPNFKLVNLEGDTISLKKLRGKIVILDFWATWCIPCKASFPYLQEFWEQHKKDPKIALFAINTSENIKGKKRIEKVKNFMVKNKYTFPILLDDEQSSVKKAYEISSIPTKYFIGPNGKIYFIEIGFHGPSMVEDMNIQIELIKEKLRSLF